MQPPLKPNPTLIRRVTEYYGNVPADGSEDVLLGDDLGEDEDDDEDEESGDRE